MLYITGDTHGNFERFSTRSFPEGRYLTNDDYVIILGDFGGIWDFDESNKSELYTLKWLEDKPFSILFLDGNHENFDRLQNFPTKPWHGGQVHEIRPSILHLMRGEIYEIEGKSFFVFGGAASHDIADGILEPDDKRIKQWQKERRHFRINHISWWKEEMPSRKEMEHGIANLEQHNNSVDFILTHSPSSQMADTLGYHNFDELTSYQQFIHQTTHFKKWYFGHLHRDVELPEEKAHCLYKNIITLNN